MVLELLIKTSKSVDDLEHGHKRILLFLETVHKTCSILVWGTVLPISFFAQLSHKKGKKKKEENV